ncbi:MAG: hypothetical protein WBB85_22280 [Albidovulum sp.]|uniref:hypothetical protein n=1 Tax=Albidovulum sp. TaxID=1872424 RepID=UPI003CB95CD2
MNRSRGFSVLLIAASTVIATGPGAAGDGAPLPVDGAALVRALPERVLDRIRKRPASYIEVAAEAILSFGAGGGIGMAGIEESILAERAKVWAREMERFLRADLNNDGRMTAQEVDGLIRRTYQGWRGKLKVAQGTADADGDGLISADELVAYASAAAYAAVGEDEALDRMALMAFDLDHDGQVTLAEVMDGVEALVALDLSVVRKDI